MHSAFACGLSGIDVDASSSYCKSCCDDRDAVATGRLRPDGHWRGLSAPVCHQYGSVLGTAPPIALQEDRIPLWHDSHTQETPVGTKARPSAKAAARLEFVQDYIPLKEIRNGIVETTDGRYLKILEIEPINFLLRSNEEQWGIISTFASWLKISPMRLQFKSVTRKADSDKYVAGLEADIESEDVTACRELGRGTIQFIREEGSVRRCPAGFS